MHNAKDDNRTNDKNISKRQRELYTIHLSINHDLQPLVILRSKKLGLTQKQYISKLIYDDLIKTGVSSYKNDSIEALDLLYESFKLNKINIDNKKLSKEDKIKIKNLVVDYYNTFEKIDHDELIRLSRFVSERLKSFREERENSNPF